jgi:streptolysin S family bacteriocin protoxin
VSVTARALPTAYDPPAGAVTVATPSCCCCCCCCLNAVGAGATVVTAAARAAARSNHRPQVVPTLLGLGAVVAAGAVAWLLVQGLDVRTAPVPIASAIIAYGAMTVAALHSGGVKLRTAVLVAIAFACGTALLATIELFVALFTALLIEFAAPLSMWGGWVMGRSMMSDDAGAPPVETAPDEPTGPATDEHAGDQT